MAMGFAATTKARGSIGIAAASRPFEGAKQRGRQELLEYDEWGLLFEGYSTLPVLFSDPVAKKSGNAKKADELVNLLGKLQR